MHDINETMIEKLEEEPDAAVLVTIDELNGDDNLGTISLFADEDERDDLARRVLAARAAALLAKHFPNETKYGTVNTAGGRASYNGVFRDPEADWEAYHDPEDDDPPVLEELAEVGD